MTSYGNAMPPRTIDILSYLSSIVILLNSNIQYRNSFSSFPKRDKFLFISFCRSTKGYKSPENNYTKRNLVTCLGICNCSRNISFKSAFTLKLNLIIELNSHESCSQEYFCFITKIQISRETWQTKSMAIA